MKSILLFTLLILLTGCGIENSSCQVADKSFNSFLEQWIANKSFSLERTLYPLKQVNHVAGEEGKDAKTSTLLSREQMIGSKSLNEYEIEHGLTHEIMSQNNNSATISVSKPNTD